MKRIFKNNIYLFISLFLLISNIVLFVIGVHSNRLINTFFKWFSLLIIIICLAYISMFIYRLIKNRNNILKIKKNIIITSLLGFYLLLCISFLVLLYGPNKTFRTWLITTAVNTMHHRYYCEWFYNEDEIKEIMSENFIDDTGLETDPLLVDHNETK